ncbi:unnamed protein product [Protopolystoma xenopodis]|uniref:G-protein coupled receptors family 2 profile 1 domain-containing protein n=1 Tax=Protopolystoma xenopodis TaxID=117903 RepID=A0A448X0R0_9PLAT|nr:unnamed protein product [Protopolystoma xenopodis]
MPAKRLRMYQTHGPSLGHTTATMAEYFGQDVFHQFTVPARPTVNITNKLNSFGGEHETEALEHSRLDLPKVCPPIYDGALCWPPALSEQRLYSPCPRVFNGASYNENGEWLVHEGCWNLGASGIDE